MIGSDHLFQAYLSILGEETPENDHTITVLVFSFTSIQSSRDEWTIIAWLIMTHVRDFTRLAGKHKRTACFLDVAVG